MVGIINLKWRDAMSKTGHAFTEAEQKAGWAIRMSAPQLAALQRPPQFFPSLDRMLSPGTFDPSEDARRERVKEYKTLLKALQAEFDAGLGPDTAPLFAAWLAAQGETPSAHIAAWFEAVGLSQRPIDAPAVPALAESASDGETAEQRQARRFQACIDAGLTIPSDDYSHLPVGIGTLAKAEGITRQSFSADVKAHIRRLNGR